MLAKLIEKAKTIFSSQPEAYAIQPVAIQQMDLTFQLQPRDVEIKNIYLVNLLDQKKDATYADTGDNAFDQLPQEVKLAILEYLTVKQLCSVASVSKHWNYLSSLNALWQKIPHPPLSFPFKYRTYKEDIRDAYESSRRLQKRKFMIDEAVKNRNEIHDLVRTRNDIHLLTNLQFPEPTNTLVVPQDSYIEGGDEAHPETRFVMKLN